MLDSVCRLLGAIDKVAQIDEIVKNNKDFTSIISRLRSTTQELLGFGRER